MLAFKGIGMTSRDADILESVNRLASDDRANLIEFIGVRDVTEEQITSVLAAHAHELTGASPAE